MTTPVKVDHVTKGLSRLITQWQDKPKVRGLLEATLREAQELEEVFFSLLNSRDVYTASGVWLEILGSIVGEFREGRRDGAYRNAILNKIILNRSDGTYDSIYNALNSILSTENIKIWEHYPAYIFTYVGAPVSNSTAITLDLISMAGVGSTLVFDVYGDSFIPAATVKKSAYLALENNDLLEVYDGQTTAFIEVDFDVEIVGTGNRSFLPHSKERGLVNPLAVSIRKDAPEYEAIYLQVGEAQAGEGEVGGVYYVLV